MEIVSSKKIFSIQEIVEITQWFALRLLDNPDESLDLNDRIKNYLGLNLVQYHNRKLPKCSIGFLEYFVQFLENNPGINRNNIGSVVNLLHEDFQKIPYINRPKNQIELENKVKKHGLFYLINALLILWESEIKEIPEDCCFKDIFCLAVEFYIVFEEIGKSYDYDNFGNIRPEFRKKIDHSRRYIRTYLCLHCGVIFFSKSNNAKYCLDCTHKVRMNNQKQRRKTGERIERCLYCNKILDNSKTKPKKYCTDECRYADRKKKVKVLSSSA